MTTKPSTTPDAALCTKTPLQQACIELNQAIDSYWNAPKGMQLTGIGEVFVKEITKCQQKCKGALEAEGVALGSNP